MSQRSVLQPDDEIIRPVRSPDLAQYESELAAISRLLQFGRGQFSLSFAICNSPALRDKLIREIGIGATGIESIVVPSGTVDIFAAVRERYHGTEQGLFISGVESSISDSGADGRTIASLNASRDLWPDTVHCPVVFWLPEYAATAMSLYARDFWRVRSHRFSFVPDSVPPPMRQPETYEGRFIAAVSLPDDEKLARIDELRERLKTIGTPSDVMLPHVLRWWDELATLCQMRGDLKEVLRIRRNEELPVYERLGDVRNTAVTKGKIADVLEARGDLDEALRIRREEELPIYERLGDVRGTALMKGKIADVLEARGDLDEALRIRREEELPVYELLGDVRSTAVTKGQIADVLEARGDLDEALRIRREEQLPVYARLGDVRSMAVTKGQIADVLQARGDLDEVLRIRREEELPVYERLGDVRATAVTKGKIADVLQTRGDLEEALRIRREEQLPVYERLGDVRSTAVTKGQIADVLQARGDLDEAIRIRREDELPVYIKLAARRDVLVCQCKLAIVLLQRNQGSDRRRAKDLLREALEAAEEMKLSEAEQIRSLTRAAGL